MADIKKLMKRCLRTACNAVTDAHLEAIGEDREMTIAEWEEIMVDALIANGVTIQKWIPVTERLPERITNKVIVLCKNGYRGFGHYENYKGKQTWYNLENDRPFTDWDLEDCESYEVTHWMPLPEAPNGERRTEK